jgi:hypothetical protein
VPHAWDEQWHFEHVRQQGLCAVPSLNLVSSIGDGPNATHIDHGLVWLDLPRTAFKFPLIQLLKVAAASRAEAFLGNAAEEYARLVTELVLRRGLSARALRSRHQPAHRRGVVGAEQ